MRVNCQDDPELFFAEAEHLKRKAKRMCSGTEPGYSPCPVMDQCLQASKNSEYGIWGGLDANQRSRALGKIVYEVA